MCVPGFMDPGDPVDLMGSRGTEAEASSCCATQGEQFGFMSCPSEDLAQGALLRETHPTHQTFSLALRC